MMSLDGFRRERRATPIVVHIEIRDHFWIHNDPYGSMRLHGRAPRVRRLCLDAISPAANADARGSVEGGALLNAVKLGFLAIANRAAEYVFVLRCPGDLEEAQRGPVECDHGSRAPRAGVHGHTPLVC